MATNYIVLVKKKSAKKWQIAIPAKAGVSLTRLRAFVRKQLKSGLTAKITTSTKLKSLSGKKTVRKRIRRRKR